jgi:hypothetical protein
MIVWIDAQFSPAERDRFSCIPKAVQLALPEKSSRTIFSGYAAGCEARLCRAVRVSKSSGLGPWSGLWPMQMRAKPEPGAQPPYPIFS